MLEDITDIDAMFESMEELEVSLQEEVQIPSNLNPDHKQLVIKERLLNQQEKIGILQSKLHWMEVKQEDKQRRIEELECRKLTLKEKLHLRALKKSSFRLEEKIKCCKRLITMRSRTATQLRNQLSSDELSQLNASPIGPPKTCWVETIPELFQEDEGPTYLTLPPTLDELRAQLKHTSEELEQIRRKRSGKRSERKEEKPRTVNVVAIQHLRRNEIEKVAELKEKLKWMEEKQDGKQRRIQCMRENKASLDLEEKFKYKALKKSYKKLQEQIAKIRKEVLTRQDTVQKTTKLINKCTMSESRSLVDAELDGIQVIRVSSDHSCSEEGQLSHSREAKIADVLKVLEIDQQLQRIERDEL